MSLFEEKYGDTVRVVSMGNVSLELCGGTHVSRTGRIGTFIILSESSVAAGIRRIEAVTGLNAYRTARAERNLLHSVSQNLNTLPENIVDRIEGLSLKIRELEKEIKRLRTESAFGGDDILSKAVNVDGIKVAFGRIAARNAEELKTAADKVREKIGSGVGVLGAEIDGKVSIVVTVTDDMIQKRSLKAGDIVKIIAELIGGSGGGRPHMAMAGGKDVTKLDSALESAPDVVARFLKG
jgi:alanyl-tRNA synthetase